MSTFLTTDQAAYLWFLVQGAAARDVASSEWWTPAGRLLTSPGGAWAPLEDPGSYCFSERLTIAGNPLATPGTWTVKIFWNGKELGSVNFTIQAAPQCSYSLSATSVSAPAAGTTGSVTVTAPAGCAWTAASNASWVTITSGASGSGNGTVQFTVAANTASTSRTGTLTVAGQTVTVTQAAAGPACSYSLSTTSVSAPAAGTTGSVTVTAPAGCAWAATSNASWVTITSGASGTGNGTVQFTVAANTATASRTGTLTVAGQTVTVTQAAAAPAAPRPVISAGGVLNGADYTPEIAPGMMVSIFGENLAPRTTAAQAVPLPTELEGVSVEVTEGSKPAVRAPLYFVSAGQINIQMPFGITASSVQVRVRTAQGVSDPATVAIVPRAPRLFTRTMDGKGEPILLHATDYSWVSADAPAKAGEYLVLLLTGLGEVSPAVEAGRPGGDDGRLGPINRVTTPVTVSVGGREVPTLFAGLMPGFPGIYQINFQAPADLEGGFQPIVVSAGGVSSQVDVAAAIEWNLPVLASGTVDAAGGVVKGGGVSVSIPAGALAESKSITVYEVDKSADPGGVRLSPVVKITGLPATLSAPLTVTLDLPAPPPPGTSVEAVVQTDAGIRGMGLHTFDATLEGNRITFEIPATEESSGGPASAPPVRQASSTPVPAVILRGAGVELAKIFARRLWNVKSPSGRFLVSFNPFELSDVQVEDVVRLDPQTLERAYSLARGVAAAFDDADQKLRGLDLSWGGRTRWPVRVLLAPFGEKHADKWGMQQTSFWGVNSSNILLNATRLGRQGVTAEMRATVGHELFHLMQEAYDPRTRYKKVSEPGAWYWFLEALSTWFESIMLESGNYIPSTVLNDDWAFLTRRGLEFPSGDQSELAHHGYGASMFLRFLSSKRGGDARLAGVLKRMSARTSDWWNPQPQLSPVAALRLDYPDLSEAWAAFVRAFMAGKGIYDNTLFPGADMLASAATGDRYYGFRTDADKGTTFEWLSQDLSARLHKIDFRAQWLPGSVASLQLVDPEGHAEAILYKQPGWRQVAVFRDSYTLENADQLAANKELLYVMVTNFRARAPYTGVRPLKLIVDRAGPPQTSYNRTRTATIYNGYFQATINVKVSGREFRVTRDLVVPPRNELHILETVTPRPSPTGPQEDQYTVTVSVSDASCVKNCISGTLITKGAFGSEGHAVGNTFSKTVTVQRGGKPVSLSFSVVFGFRPPEGAEVWGGSGTVFEVTFAPQR